MNQQAAALEAEIQSKGLTALRVTPTDVEAAIASEYFFTAANGVLGASIDRGAAVDRFLGWPVPPSVYPDGVPGAPGRTGTNLLSASEASDMLEHVLGTAAAEPQLGLITICVLRLKNGHQIVGVNEGPITATNFDAQIGRRLARQKAVDQIWPLLGYQLRERLHQEARS